MADRLPIPIISRLLDVVLDGTITAGPNAAFSGTFDATNATFTGLTVSGGTLTNITLITPTIVNPTINGGTLNNVTINTSNFVGGTVTGATIVNSTVLGNLTLSPTGALVGGGTPPATIAYSPSGFNMTGFFNAVNSDWTFDPTALHGLINFTTISIVTDANPLLTPPGQLTLGLNFYTWDNGPYRGVVMQFGNPTSLAGNALNTNDFTFDAGKIPAAFRPVNNQAAGVINVEYSTGGVGVGVIYASRIVVLPTGAMQIRGSWDVGSAVVMNNGWTYAYMADGTVPI